MGAEAGLVFFVVVVAVAFYWILLRPVIVQQRRQRSDIQNLEVGDEVLTQAGFIARVKDIRVPPEGPTEIVLELGPGLEVRAYATAIVQKLGPKPDAPPVRPADSASADGGTEGVVEVEGKER
ncbi:MAG TPA: preprotein translocase subunit YajC [Dehalococcoidia bacterium]|nr:preprotein translocase subunit YajC [Dehalococcoidia bacterium]